MLEVLAYADKLLSLIPIVLQVGGDVLGTIQKGRADLATMKAQNRGPTPEEWAALDGQIDALMAQLKG